MHMLVHLSLALCDLDRVDFPALPNLLFLNLSHNRLTSVQSQQLQRVSQLRDLTLASNPLTAVWDTSFPDLPSLTNLHMSNVSLLHLDVGHFSVVSNLVFLNLSANRITSIESTFQGLRHLQVLDISGSPVSRFPREVFSSLQNLDFVSTENYKLCCPVNLPADFNVHSCHSPFDEISSCDDLLRSGVYRVAVAVLATLTLLGNSVSLVYRLLVERGGRMTGYTVFVVNLCVSDLLMGVYLAVIGVADRLYLGRYLWKDVWWRHSVTCWVAGVLCVVSSEVSALTILLITVDRCLVLRFPFSSLHLGRRSAGVASGLAWGVGVVLGGLPLLPALSRWRFYSHRSVCVPLPISRPDFGGHSYAFALLVCLNSALCVLIAGGQAFIYRAVTANSMTDGRSTKKTQDLLIARRLLSVAVSDFLCWFPIGLAGLLAAHHVPVPGEVNVALAMTVMPLNSAINPFLYTLNILLEKRRRAREQRVLEWLSQKVKVRVREVTANKLAMQYSRREAAELARQWLANGLVDRADVSFSSAEGLVDRADVSFSSAEGLGDRADVSFSSAEGLVDRADVSSSADGSLQT